MPADNRIIHPNATEKLVVPFSFVNLEIVGDHVVANYYRMARCVATEEHSLYTDDNGAKRLYLKFQSAFLLVKER